MPWEGRGQGWPEAEPYRCRCPPMGLCTLGASPAVPQLLTSSDTRLSTAPSIECSAPEEAEGSVSGLARCCSQAAHSMVKGKAMGRGLGSVTVIRKMGIWELGKLVQGHQSWNKWGNSEVQPTPSLLLCTRPAGGGRAFWPQPGLRWP